MKTQDLDDKQKKTDNKSSERLLPYLVSRIFERSLCVYSFGNLASINAKNNYE